MIGEKAPMVILVYALVHASILVKYAARVRGKEKLRTHQLVLDGVVYSDMGSSKLSHMPRYIPLPPPPEPPPWPA